MTNTASKLKRALCSMVVMLALVAGITSIPVLAASNGIYTATATSHYKHPTTEKIEDSGGEGSYVLGQSMTESALNKAALVEVDPQGNTFVTVRLNLMDNIQNPQFQVDGSRNGNFSSVSATVMQEDFTNNTTDFRMQVPSENAIIRCNMYVIPMGRDVIFYITVGNLQSGSLKALKQEGYITQDDSSAVRLTETGLEIARATYERHQTFQSLLENLGVDGKTAAADACLMEHAVSPESYEAIKGLAKRKEADGYE